jgi:5'-methylthioadenosine phosphorylase
MKSREGPFGIIAGTGVFDHFETGAARKVKTPFGTVVVFDSEGVVLLPRHGRGHTVPPHRINYRANVSALAAVGVREVIATSAVGSMNVDFRVGDLGVVGQFLDFTKGRPSTFFDDKVVHTDMTNPYSGRLNGILGDVGKKIGIEVRKGLVYACMEGPRFETAAEIRMLRQLGADVVGMTGVPEVVLVNEKRMEYSSLVIATNWAAGLQRKVSHEEVVDMMRKSGRKAKELIEETIKASRREAQG